MMSGDFSTLPNQSVSDVITYDEDTFCGYVFI